MRVLIWMILLDLMEPFQNWIMPIAFISMALHKGWHSWLRSHRPGFESKKWFKNTLNQASDTTFLRNKMLLNSPFFRCRNTTLSYNTAMPTSSVGKIVSCQHLKQTFHFSGIFTKKANWKRILKITFYHWILWRIYYFFCFWSWKL